MSEHDFLDRLVTALHESDVPDPRAVAIREANATPEPYRLGALVQAACALAPLLASTERRSIRAGARPKGGSTRSPRWEAAVASYTQMLRMRIATEEGHVFLGDASRQQVRHQVTVRRAHAAATLEQATWFERIEGAMTAHDVLRVKDLPGDVLAALWNGAAG